MLQRIQTVWMALAFLSAVALYFTKDHINLFWWDASTSILIGGVLVTSLLSIFSFKTRKRQILLNTISIIINALLIGLLAYWLLNLSGGISFPEKGIEPIFPLLAIICLFIANMLIRRDERLVKSVDRLR